METKPKTSILQRTYSGLPEFIPKLASTVQCNVCDPWPNLHVTCVNGAVHDTLQPGIYRVYPYSILPKCIPTGHWYDIGQGHYSLRTHSA